MLNLRKSYIKLKGQSKGTRYLGWLIIIGIRNYFKTTIRQCDTGEKLTKRTMKENRESADRPIYIKAEITLQINREKTGELVVHMRKID